ncbi:MAG: DUF1294 domain-containing protein [Novosphingobium sp.]|nr:DUF1294 domain-containing protein [Novosphingobium sp.]
MELWAYGLGALLAINAFTALRFWQDKRASLRGQRRVSEADLLGLALIGGTPGAYFARHRFRHKTRKEPFSGRLRVIAVVQCLLVAVLLIALG